MKRCQPLLFVVAILLPHISLAQGELCDDPAKVLIGFGILVAVFLSMLFSLTLVAYFLIGGRKHLKKLGVLLVLSLLFGVMSVTAGLVKEYSKNNIPFLHPDCLERNT